MRCAMSKATNEWVLPLPHLPVTAAQRPQSSTQCQHPVTEVEQTSGRTLLQTVVHNKHAPTNQKHRTTAQQQRGGEEWFTAGLSGRCAQGKAHPLSDNGLLQRTKQQLAAKGKQASQQQFYYSNGLTAHRLADRSTQLSN